MPATTVLYYRPGCPFAMKLRLGLTLHGVPFTAVRFEDDADNASRARVASGGNEISPTVNIGERWLVNPTWREVAHLARR